jgi:hypothetical protein
MRVALLFVLIALSGAGVFWVLSPPPAAACSCGSPALISELERADGSSSGPAMCLRTELNQWPLLVPCDARFFFHDEAFGVVR